MNEEMIKEALKKAFPPVFGKCQVTELSGGLINSRTVTNRMSIGTGPPSFKYGNKVGFTRDIFIEWVIEQIEVNK